MTGSVPAVTFEMSMPNVGSHLAKFKIFGVVEFSMLLLIYASCVAGVFGMVLGQMVAVSFDFWGREEAWSNENLGLGFGFRVSRLTETQAIVWEAWRSSVYGAIEPCTVGASVE